ncbi:MAG: type II toxin-antitoxin system RelE family toxin [Armatimonadota bacterium]
MSYRLDFSRTAIRGITQLHPQVNQRLKERILALADDPKPPGSRQLVGQPAGSRRLRVGDYRVLYHVDEEARVVTIMKVGPRGSVYS